MQCIVGIIIMRPKGPAEFRECVALDIAAVSNIIGFPTDATGEVSSRENDNEMHKMTKRVADLEAAIVRLERHLGRVERLAVLPNFEIPATDTVKRLKDLAGQSRPGIAALVKADIDVARVQEEHEDHFKISRLAKTIDLLLESGSIVLVLGAQGLTSVKLLEPTNNQSLAWHERALDRQLPREARMLRYHTWAEFERGATNRHAGANVILLPNLLDLSTEDDIYSGMSRADRFTDRSKALQSACEQSHLATKLRPYYDIFILDDFRSTVWTLPSNVGLAAGKPRAVGVGLEADLRCLERLVARCIETGRKGNITRLCVSGSSRPEDVEVVETFVESRLFDQVLIGPIPSLLFYFAEGLQLSSGLMEDLEHLATQSGNSLGKLAETSATRILSEFRDRIELPVDYVISDKNGRRESRIVQWSDLPKLRSDERVMAIGPATLEAYSEKITEAGLIFHFGMMGSGEAPYISATTEIIRRNVESGAEVYMAGDHIVELAHDLGLASGLSGAATGAQTTSAYMTGTKLPGLAPFVNGRA